MKVAMRSSGNNMMKFLPKPTSYAMTNPPFSHGSIDRRSENTQAKVWAPTNSKTISGPVKLIPAEARRKSRSARFEEPSSPKVSCMGKIERKKKPCRSKRRSSPPQQVKKRRSFAIGKMFRRKVRLMSLIRPSKMEIDTDNLHVPMAAAPSLGQLKRFTGRRENNLAGFDRKAATVYPIDGDGDDDDKATVPCPAPKLLGQLKRSTGKRENTLAGFDWKAVTDIPIDGGDCYMNAGSGDDDEAMVSPPAPKLLGQLKRSTGRRENTLASFDWKAVTVNPIDAKDCYMNEGRGDDDEAMVSPPATKLLGQLKRSTGRRENTTLASFDWKAVTVNPIDARDCYMNEGRGDDDEAMVSPPAPKLLGQLKRSTGRRENTLASFDWKAVTVNPIDGRDCNMNEGRGDDDEIMVPPPAPKLPGQLKRSTGRRENSLSGFDWKAASVNPIDGGDCYMNKVCGDDDEAMVPRPAPKLLSEEAAVERKLVNLLKRRIMGRPTTLQWN